MKKIILASTSPRRKEILSELVDTFEIIAPDCEEVEFAEPEETAKSNAEAKARSVKTSGQAVVIGCDTVVACGKKQYGKPGSRDKAIEMLKELAGIWHSVFSGVCVIADKIYSYTVESKVKLKALSEAEIELYVENFLPYDKAGAYGIQDKMVVDTYYGEYNNIVGLPTLELQRILRENDINVKK